MKSMISTRARNEMNRVSISMSENEAKIVYEILKKTTLKNKCFFSHLGKCLARLRQLMPYDSTWIRDPEPGLSLDLGGIFSENKSSNS